MSSLDDSNIFTVSADIGGDGHAVAVKDCIDIGGMKTGCGSAAFDDAPVAECNADVVEALLAHDCRIVGKANMHELAYGVTGINAHTGTPLNPRFPDLIVGGSSSGSAAAVAADLVDFSIGTDTGGSIRMPAACCGIFGMKPTFGAISRHGAVPATSSLDCIGPFARDMAMLVQAMNMICPGFQVPAVPDRLVLGRVAAPADEDIDDALGAFLQRASVAVKPITLPSLREAHEAGIAIMAAEMAALFGDLVGTGKLGPDIDARIAAGMKVSLEQVVAAEKIRSRFTREVEAALATCDALVLPTLPSVPLRVADATDAKAALHLTELVRPFNLSGHPALSLPTRAAQGLPAGVQLVGRRGGDAALCGVALALEGAL